jgi:Resolvase, N terminal domain
VIVVAYFDRLFRSVSVQHEVAERVEAAGGALFAAEVGEVRSDTASGSITSSMLGVVAEYHRHRTRERTIEGKRRAIAGFSLALKLGVTIEDIAAMHHVFPTFGERVKGAAEQAVAAPEASMVMSTAR